MQMATNLAAENGQTFVLGRRVHHTDFETGQHDELPENFYKYSAYLILILALVVLGLTRSRASFMCIIGGVLICS